MNLKKILNWKNRWEEKYDNLVKTTFESMGETIQQLTVTVGKQSEIILNIDDKESNTETVIETKNDPALEKELKELKIQLKHLKEEKESMLKRLNNNDELWDKEGLVERYNQLLEFAFKNIDPFTNVDIIEAQQYYREAIKKYQ